MINPIKTIGDKIKANKSKLDAIEKESTQIFIKNNQTGPMTKYKNRLTGQYPKVNEFSPKEYKNEVNRVKKQVTDLRMK